MSTHLRASVYVVVVLTVLATGGTMQAEAIPQADATIRAIQLPVHLRRNVERMLRTSATFRLQWERIVADGRVVVSVREDAFIRDRGYHARSAIHRYSSGLLVVMVVVGCGDRQAEWIAHEFEHILEQLDGWNLTALADRRGSGVWPSGGGMFETTRAIRAGRIVRGELRRETERSDKLVE